MSDTKHTPGPWTLIGKHGTAIWAGDAIVAQVTGARAFHPIARANAELIASAPDMAARIERLEAALREFIKADKWEMSLNDWEAMQNAARALIGEAKP